jgi:GGDEF domain-containing protein
VLYCDTGKLNVINEDAGDVVRSTLAARIRDCLRAEYAVSRLEDDKLWVVLRGVHNLVGVVAVRNKIRHSVTGPIPYHLAPSIRS